MMAIGAISGSCNKLHRFTVLESRKIERFFLIEILNRFFIVLMRRHLVAKI